MAKKATRIKADTFVVRYQTRDEGDRRFKARTRTPCY